MNPQVSGTQHAGSPPKPCQAASDTQGLTADQLAGAYQITPLEQAGRNGAGVTVAVIETGHLSLPDVDVFAACYGLGTPDIVTRSAYTGPPDSHATQVVETILSIAPRAKILLYEVQGSYMFSAILPALQSALASHASIISISWGGCETELTGIQGRLAKALPKLDGLLQQAAGDGVSVIAGSGNRGVNCVFTTPNRTLFQLGQLGVSFPNVDPWVTSVGGTTLQLEGGRRSEQVWHSGGGASGGGISSLFVMPAYQQGLGTIPGESSGDPCGASHDRRLVTPAPLCREVPDVSADADPSSGYVVYSGGAWKKVGGTSYSTPLWSGLVALMDQGCANDPAGFLNPKLYAAAAASGYPNGPGSAFHDVTVGNNDTAGIGKYQARVGYDLATGLGTPDGWNLAPYLSCKPAVSTVAPDQGPKAGGEQVRIEGSGFGWGAHLSVHFGQNASPRVTVVSPTQIDAVAPSSALAGTVDVTVTTPAGTSSTRPADSYTYVPLPGGIVTVDGPGFSDSVTGGALLFGHTWEPGVVDPDGPGGPKYVPAGTNCAYRGDGLALQPMSGVVEQSLEFEVGAAAWSIRHLTPGWRYTVSTFLPAANCFVTPVWGSPKVPSRSSFSVTDAGGTRSTAVHEDGRRSGWVSLGTYSADRSGAITVHFSADVYSGVVAYGGVGIGWLVPPERAYVSAVDATPAA